MFRKNWQYAGLAPDIESVIRKAGGCSAHTARAFASRLRRAARGIARNHWPSPFLIPGMESFARAFISSIRSDMHFAIALEGTEADLGISAPILQMAHERLTVSSQTERPGPVSFRAGTEILSADEGMAPALFALQTGIALRLATHPWFDRILAVIDFETTGFSATDSRITEYGLVLVRNEVILSTHGSLINPGIPIPREITQITGIDDAMVANAPREEIATGELASLLTGAGMIGGHNYTDFDSRFLESMFARSGRTPPILPVFDTLHLARAHIFGQTNNKQPTLLAWLGWPGNVFHRAVDDSLGCAFILRAALRGACGAHTLIEQSMPLVLLAGAQSGPDLVQAGTETLARQIATLFPGLPGENFIPAGSDRESEFCTRVSFDDPRCGAQIMELGKTIHDASLDGIVFLLENMPASSTLRTVLPEDGLMLELPGLGLLISASQEVRDDARIRQDARYDLIIRLEAPPAEGVAAGRLLDMRLNPLALRS